MAIANLPWNGTKNKDLLKIIQNPDHWQLALKKNDLPLKAVVCDRFHPFELLPLPTAQDLRARVGMSSDRVVTAGPACSRLHPSVSPTPCNP